MSFDKYPANELTNKQLDKILAQFGDIIVPTNDVYAEIFFTGKKKVRLNSMR